MSSVDSLSVTDSTSDDKLRKIVSLAEDTDKVSSLEVCYGYERRACVFDLDRDVD